MKHGCARALARILLVTSTLLAPGAAAWNDAGHLVVALAAWDALPADAHARLSQIVGSFPRFRPDFEALRPAWIDGASASDRQRWYFAFAATWPDRARHFGYVRNASERAALVRLYDRPRWHYVNLPTYLAGSDRAALSLRSPRLDAPASAREAELNIVQALTRLERAWRVGEDADRALALTWIAHLVADLHQPLHATSLYALGRLAKGDRGGNEIAVGADGNLHREWDGALGASRRPQDLERVRASLEIASVARPMRIDFAAWARESQKIASERVYSRVLRAAIESQRPDRARLEVMLDRRYRDDMRAVARERAAVAAVRLAAVFESLIAR